MPNYQVHKERCAKLWLWCEGDFTRWGSGFPLSCTDSRSSLLNYKLN